MANNAIKPDIEIYFVSFFSTAVAMYVVWQVLYLYVTEVFFKDYLASDDELVTSLRYLARDTRNGMHQLVRTVSQRLGLLRKDEPLDPSKWKTKCIFVTTQFIYTLITLIPPYFLFRSYYLCVATLILTFSWGTWNGASYYIEVFSKR